MKLIKEEQNEIKVITEQAENGEPEYYLEGVFLQANIKNRNGRIYPMEVMEPEVERYIDNFVKSKRAFGTLNHPSGNQTPNIDLKEISHVITDLWREGDYFMGRAKVLDTPNGRIVKSLIKEGCTLGMSSRALGKVSYKNGTAYVDKDGFKLITAGDIVWEPSCQVAYMNGLMEDQEWEYDEKTDSWIPHAESEKEIAEQLSKLQIEKFRDFLSNIKK